jgi:hypothetical protein
MSGRNVLLAGLLGAGLLVSGSAAASRQVASTITIDRAKVTAKWKESFMKGSLSFSGTSSEAIQVEASIRSDGSHELVARPLVFTASSTFAKTIKLGARPVPGPYTLTLANTLGTKLAVRPVTIPAPPEGVVDRAYTSKTRNGPAVKAIRNAKIIYAHFHFVARPQTNVLTFNWRKPGNPKVRFTGYAKKRYDTNVVTFVCVKKVGGICVKDTTETLVEGKWYCIVYAAGRVVMRQRVTVL